MFEACQNPICQNRIEPLASDNGKRAWRRTPRLFCSEQCKIDFWAVRRVAAMLQPLGQARGWEVLQSLGNGDTQDKAQSEIVNPGAT